VDLIILDVDLPDISGLAIPQRIRASRDFDRTPVIMATSHEEYVLIGRTYRLGAAAFVVKPVNWRLLAYNDRFLLRAVAPEADDGRMRSKGDKI
jgi:two-component system sensor histidine kinase/response regulator